MLYNIVRTCSRGLMPLTSLSTMSPGFPSSICSPFAAILFLFLGNPAQSKNIKSWSDDIGSCSIIIHWVYFCSNYPTRHCYLTIRQPMENCCSQKRRHWKRTLIFKLTISVQWHSRVRWKNFAKISRTFQQNKTKRGPEDLRVLNDQMIQLEKAFIQTVEANNPKTSKACYLRA